MPRRVIASTLGWTLPAPTARQALVPDGPATVVLAGGMLPDGTSTDRAVRISLPNGRSHPLPRLAVPVHDAAGGRYAGKVAVFGGGNATEQAVVQVLAGRRWQRAGSLPTTRSDLSVVATPAGTLVLGGYDGVGTPLAILRHSATSGLHGVGRLAVGVRYAATVLVGSSVYVFGGEVSGHELGQVQRFDVRPGGVARVGRVSVVGRLPHPLGHAMAAVFGDRVLLMGGRTSADQQTGAMWWYDPATGRFSHAGRLPRPLSDAAVATVGHSAYLLGGEDPNVTGLVVRVTVLK
ncbi:MAG: kelch repeat-containing protein [Actinomycetota bacterium]|nr:kelch repeat-containing protein [Actinomycetota bacterium]